MQVNTGYSVHLINYPKRKSTNFSKENTLFGGPFSFNKNRTVFSSPQSAQKALQKKDDPTQYFIIERNSRKTGKLEYVIADRRSIKRVDFTA